MRTLFTALIIVALVAPAFAQPDASRRDALIDSLRTSVQVLMPSADDPPTFSAEWRDGGGQMGGNVNTGVYFATGAPLGRVLRQAWTSHFPYRQNPLSGTVWSRLIDAPDSLMRRGVGLTMVQPGLTRETHGAYLIDQLSDALGLEVRTENRPTVVYALRARSGMQVTLTPGTENRGMRAFGQEFEARANTSADLARSLGGSLGHIVIDETGLDGTYDLRLAFSPDEVDFDAATMPAEQIDTFRARLVETTGLELVPEVRPVEWLVVRARK